jgi:predicted nucleic acid-binding protein
MYLDCSALWNYYYQEAGAAIVEHVLQRADYACSSSAWSMLELYRGVKKRLNQNEISIIEAANLRAFIDLHLKHLVLTASFGMLHVSTEIIDRAKELIGTLNLYSADAVHLASALNEGCSHFLVDDYHFTRLHGKIEARLGLVIIPTNLDIGLLPKQT